jgi:exopolysaccharide biosynthesis polyprenyl glycosylphosphotransferase
MPPLRYQIMKQPIRINNVIIQWLLILADLLAGISSYSAIKALHPEAHIYFPKLIDIHSQPSEMCQMGIFASYWFVIIGLSGFYRQIKQKSAFQYLSNFLLMFFAGMVFFTFFFFSNNQALFSYGIFHFFAELIVISLSLYFLPRVVYYIIISWLMKHNKAAIYAILVGNSPKSQTVFEDFAGYGELLNYHFIGYIQTENDQHPPFTNRIPCLGDFSNFSDIIEKHKIDEVIVTIDSEQNKMIEQVLAIVKQKDITIRLLPDMNAILEGTVKMNNVKGIPLLTIRNNLMPVWQTVVKMAVDYLGSIIALILSLPLIPFIIIGIKTTSQGPVFFFQRRVGKNGKSFKIIKFRSMYIDAEQNGPALSSANDMRITPFGKVLRKWHFDEIPQFINVLKGEMSIVGPRPERKHFIDQIVPIAPYYKHLFRIRPGITSWGMVKYGYAENVEQMIERSKYDIIYLENMTLLVDLKIIVHTIRAVFTGKGK